MKRIVALAICLALCLALLAGCKLIVKDPRAAALEVNGQAVTKTEMDDAVNADLKLLRAYYEAAGYGRLDTTDKEVISSVREDVIETKTRELVIAQKMAEYGVEPLTDDEKEAATANLYLYASWLGYDAEHPDSSDSLSALIQAEMYFGLSDADTAISDATDAKLMPVVTDGMVTITDEDVQTAYDAKTEEDSGYYTDVSATVQAINEGELVTYTPEAIRLVKQILIEFTDEDSELIEEIDAEIENLTFTIEDYEDSLTEGGIDYAAYEDAAAREENGAEASFSQRLIAFGQTVRGSLNDDEEPADEALPALTEEQTETLRLLRNARSDLARLQQERVTLLADAYEHIRDTADDVVERARSGDDWDELTELYNDDPGMMEGESTARLGYAVYEGYSDFDQAFVDAAMALESVGDVSDPAEGAYGFYIIRLEADLEAGAIPLELVYDSVYESAYGARQQEIYDSLVDQWVSEAVVVRHDEVYD